MFNLISLILLHRGFALKHREFGTADYALLLFLVLILLESEDDSDEGLVGSDVHQVVLLS